MTLGPPPCCATLLVKSSVPRLQLVLVIEPDPAELIVVVPAALQFHVGEVRKRADQVLGLTLTAGGKTCAVQQVLPVCSQPLLVRPSQSIVPEAHATHAPAVQV